MALRIEQANAEIQALIDEQLSTGKKVITEDSLKEIISRLDIYAGENYTPGVESPLFPRYDVVRRNAY